MKTISIRVREGFAVPSLLEGTDELGCKTRESALLIGSRVIEDGIHTGYIEKETEDAAKREETRALRTSLEAEKRSNSSRQSELLGEISYLTQKLTEKSTALQSAEEYNRTLVAGVAKAKRDLYAELELEKVAMKAELEKEVKEMTEKMNELAVKSAVLQERERAARERDDWVKQFEERANAQLTRMDERREREVSEARKSLEELKREHEELTTKLLQRLEANGRGGSGSTTSAAALGRTFEENVSERLRQAFGARQGFSLEDVHSTGHSGDLLMTFDGSRILVELKSYDPRTKVPTKEVEKLARDVIETRVDGAIMISACSDITGHYSYGPLEVSTSVAGVPVLFINNFLSLGDPLITLHMMRVFLHMVGVVVTETRRAEQAMAVADGEEGDEFVRLRRVSAECARRCTSFLTELSRQSTELVRQVNAMKMAANKLRESVVSFIEGESARFDGLIRLFTNQEDLRVPLDPSMFIPASNLDTEKLRLSQEIAAAFCVVDHEGGAKCETKDMITFIREKKPGTSEGAARDLIKAIFQPSRVRRGHIAGLVKRQAT